jgi:hypothetical protein
VKRTRPRFARTRWRPALDQGFAGTGQKLVDAGTEVLQSTPQEFSEYRRKQAAKWAEAIRKAGISLD